MLKSRLNKEKANNKTETDLLFQGYQREVSRAHTIFEVYWGMVLTLTFGNIGLLESVFDKFNLLPSNKFYFFLIAIINLGLIIIITSGATMVWYRTRIRRDLIVNEIKKLNPAT